MLIVITIVALVPFLNKAFYVDDPLFIWMAQQIATHPFDPYGFTVNWSSFSQPMSVVMQNPPLCSYYIAAITGVLGWSEPALHLSFMFWAVASVFGTFALARRFCREPVLAALLSLFTPVFLVSATSVMCDVMMLAFWVWALESWLAGLDRQQWWRFLLSAGLISFAALTKYFGIALVPLLVVYTLIRDRRSAIRLVFLLVPIAVLSNYEFITEEKYGRGLFSAAMTVSSSISLATRPSHLVQLLIGLAFGGGCFASVLFFARFVGTRLILLAAITVVTLAVAFKFSIVSWTYVESPEAPIWLEGGLFACVGAGILALTVMHFVQRKDADALLLMLWIVGTFAFATFFNWSITARTFLPSAPAVAILVIQHFERLQNVTRLKYPALVGAAALSMLVAVADYRESDCARLAAQFYQRRYVSEVSKVRFLGHWGFQYYMEHWGARPFDRTKPGIAPGEIIVGPFHEFVVAPVSPEQASRRDESTFRALPFVSTSLLGSGASFYSSFGGPLPWVINEIAPERYYEIQIK